MKTPLFRLIASLFAGLLILASAFPSFAAFQIVTSEITCEYLYIHATSDESMGNDFGYLTVTINGEIYTIVETSPFGGEETVTYTLPTGTHNISAEWQLGEGTVGVKAMVDCVEEEPEPETPVITDGRVCFGAGEVNVAVYWVSGGIDIYSINPADDKGELSIRRTAEQLKAYGKDSLIGSSDLYIPISFYRQWDGNYYLVAGPDGREGKTYECVFSSRCSKSTSWVNARMSGWDMDVSEAGCESATAK